MSISLCSDLQNLKPPSAADIQGVLITSDLFVGILTELAKTNARLFCSQQSKDLLTSELAMDSFTQLAIGLWNLHR